MLFFDTNWAMAPPVPLMGLWMDIFLYPRLIKFSLRAVLVIIWQDLISLYLFNKLILKSMSFWPDSSWKTFGFNARQNLGQQEAKSMMEEYYNTPIENRMANTSGYNVNDIRSAKTFGLEERYLVLLPAERMMAEIFIKMYK